MGVRGVTFSPEMVRALLDGRKTQTRRLIRPLVGDSTAAGKPVLEVAPYCTGSPEHGMAYYWRENGCWNSSKRFKVAHQVGDELYVREHWKTHPAYDDLPPRDMGGEEPVVYLADNGLCSWEDQHPKRLGRFRQAMHMPRWASRLTLRVVDRRFQRVDDILDADAIAEGIPRWEISGETKYSYSDEGPSVTTSMPQEAFKWLWDRLHPESGVCFDDGPWVVAYTFEVERRNVDN